MTRKTIALAAAALLFPVAIWGVVASIPRMTATETVVSRMSLTPYIHGQADNPYFAGLLGQMAGEARFCGAGAPDARSVTWRAMEESYWGPARETAIDFYNRRFNAASASGPSGQDCDAFEPGFLKAVALLSSALEDVAVRRAAVPAPKAIPAAAARQTGGGDPVALGGNLGAMAGKAIHCGFDTGDFARRAGRAIDARIALEDRALAIEEFAYTARLARETGPVGEDCRVFRASFEGTLKMLIDAGF